MDESRDVEVAGALTPMQARFVELVLGGRSNEEAKAEAGYSENVGVVSVLRSKAVQAALREGREALLGGDLTGLAMTAVRDLLAEGTPAATRGKMAIWVLERSDAKGSGTDKPLSEMSEAELLEVVAKAKKLADPGEMVDVTPHDGA